MDVRRQQKTTTTTSDKCYEESVYESGEEVLSVWKRKSVFFSGGGGGGEAYILGTYCVSTFIRKWGVFWNVFWNVFLYSKLHYTLPSYENKIQVLLFNQFCFSFFFFLFFSDQKKKKRTAEIIPLSLSSLRNLARDLITHIINPSIYHFLKHYEFFFFCFLFLGSFYFLFYLFKPVLAGSLVLYGVSVSLDLGLETKTLVMMELWNKNDKIGFLVFNFF